MRSDGTNSFGIEVFEILPVEFAAIDNAPAAQVEQVGSDQRRLRVIGEDVGVVALGGGNALALFDIFERAEKIAIGGGLFEEFLFGGGGHALFEALDQILAFAIEEQAGVANGLGVLLIGGEAGNAGSVATLDVVLQAGARMVASEIDVARRNHEALVDEGAGCGARDWPGNTGRNRANRLF